MTPPGKCSQARRHVESCQHTSTHNPTQLFHSPDCQHWVSLESLMKTQPINAFKILQGVTHTRTHTHHTHTDTHARTHTHTHFSIVMHAVLQMSNDLLVHSLRSRAGFSSRHLPWGLPSLTALCITLKQSNLKKQKLFLSDEIGEVTAAFFYVCRGWPFVADVSLVTAGARRHWKGQTFKCRTLHKPKASSKIIHDQRSNISRLQTSWILSSCPWKFQSAQREQLPYFIKLSCLLFYGVFWFKLTILMLKIRRSNNSHECSNMYEDFIVGNNK